MPRQRQQEFSTPNGSIYTSGGQLWGPEAYTTQSQVPQFVRDFYSGGASPAGWSEPAPLAGQPIVQTPTATPSPSATPAARQWSPGSAANEWTDPHTGETFYYDSDWNYVGSSGPGSASVGGTAIRDFGGGSPLDPGGTAANQWIDPATGQTHYYDADWNWLYSSGSPVSQQQQQAGGGPGPFSGASAGGSIHPSPAGGGGGGGSFYGGIWSPTGVPSRSAKIGEAHAMNAALAFGLSTNLGLSGPDPWSFQHGSAVNESSGVADELKLQHAAAKAGMSQEEYQALQDQQAAQAPTRQTALASLGDPLDWKWRGTPTMGGFGQPKDLLHAGWDYAAGHTVTPSKGIWEPVWSPDQQALLKSFYGPAWRSTAAIAFQPQHAAVPVPPTLLPPAG